MKLKSVSLLSAAGILMTYTINVQAQCDVKYTINSNWGSGATLSVDITNLGAPKTTWELAWNFSNAEKISQLWNGTYGQTGQAVRVKNAGWNGAINTNQTINFGFNIGYPSGSTLVKPVEFYLDGMKCVGKISSSVSSSKSSSSKSSSSIISSSSSVLSSSSSIISSSSSIRSSSSSLISFSSKSSSSSSSSSSSTPVLANCNGNNLTYGPRLLRVLTREEYVNSIRDLIGVNIETDLPARSVDLLLADSRINGFANNTQETVDKFVLGGLSKLANNVVNKAATNNFSTLLNCSGLAAEQCAIQFTTQSLTRIFRRPATDLEIQQYRELFASANTSEQITAALGVALGTALTSPQFLYRQETGIAVNDIRAGNNAASLPSQTIDNDAYVLTPYELASFLAFTYTGSTPDAELLDAAKNGTLASDAQIEKQVDRLLNKTSTRNHLGKFAEQWLGTETNGPGLYPVSLFGFNTTVDKSMREELQGYFNHIVLDEAGPFSKLLVNNYGIVNETLINYYGLGNVTVTQDKFAKTNFPSYLRQGGLLTSGAFVASKSSLTEPAPANVALAIRNRLLCQDAYGPATLDAQNLRANPFWQVGYAYQNLDAGSRKRTQDQYNNPINSAGVFTGITSVSDGTTITFTNAEDLAQKLAPLDAVRYCFVEHNFRAAFGTGTKTFDPAKAGAVTLSAAEQADYACEKDRLDYAMTSNGMSARAMLKRIGSLSAARYRKDRSQ
ncbi:MAG: hypothetical protein B0W54_19120 [Cellvibrio sp. 79]|nr:MAG: hypothetical protein B0W54_19120 [Cellvibrio sp. 79]